MSNRFTTTVLVLSFLVLGGVLLLASTPPDSWMVAEYKMNGSDYYIYLHPVESDIGLILRGPGGLTTFTSVRLSNENNVTAILTYYNILRNDPRWMDIEMEHRFPIEDFWLVDPVN